VILSGCSLASRSKELVETVVALALILGILTAFIPSAHHRSQPPALARKLGGIRVELRLRMREEDQHRGFVGHRTPRCTGTPNAHVSLVVLLLLSLFLASGALDLPLCVHPTHWLLQY
jgi:hypothetical protein